MTRFAALAAVLLLVGAPGAVAKDFSPGDLSVCDRERCVPIVRPEVVALLGPFYYSGKPLRVVTKPRLGAASFELQFRNGYATGIVASAKLDRFLSYGVARELRRLAAKLRPIPLTRESLARSR
jgi:hypothetical protein